MQEVWEDCNNKKGAIRSNFKPKQRFEYKDSYWQLLWVSNQKPFSIFCHNKEYHHGRNNLKYPRYYFRASTWKVFQQKKTRTEKPDVGDDEVMMMKMEMSDTNREDDEMASWQTELLSGQSEQKR